MTPLKAIQKFCIDCAGSIGDVRKCDDDNCTLHFFRFGKNPNRSGVGVISNINSKQKNAHSTSVFKNQGKKSR